MSRQLPSDAQIHEDPIAALAAVVADLNEQLSDFEARLQRLEQPDGVAARPAAKRPTCYTCGGDGCDPSSVGDWDPTVGRNPSTRQPCPACNGSGKWTAR